MAINTILDFIQSSATFLLPVVLIAIGTIIFLLATYAQRIRERFDKKTRLDSVYLDDSPHINACGTMWRREGMVVNTKTGEITAHSGPSRSLVKSLS